VLNLSWTLIALFRASSRQFDDDLNQFELAPYSVLDFSVAKQIGPLTWFAKAGNILIPEFRQQQRRYSIMVLHALCPAASGSA
jgi:hypothetical protein